MNRYLCVAYGCVSLLSFFSVALGSPCQQWGPPRIVGHLDVSQIPEASGIAASQQFTNRLYHVNDSGNGQAFFITDLQGGKTRSIRVGAPGIVNDRSTLDIAFSDFEDLSVGPCFVNDTCLFIADIGDNGGFGDSSNRKTIQVLVIKEEKNPPSWVRPVRQIALAYPDGPHNAEGLAVHPNGDIFIVTKELNVWRWKALPARLYKVSRDQWEQADETVITLTEVGTLDVPHWGPPPSTLFGQVVTALDISPDGKRFLVLTYDFAFEVFRDLSESDSWISQDLQINKDFQVINLLPLPQPEGVTYVHGAQSFIYHTEFSGRWFRLLRGQGFHNTVPPLIRVDCVQG